MSVALSSITGSFDPTGGHFQDELDDAIPDPHHLFGRGREQALLSDAYQRVVKHNSFEMVIIHGESGSGKSALVDSLRGSVCTNRGYFCAGKYFQNAGVQEPYSAIMAAFSDLCDLISQSEDFDEDWKLKIQKQLGPDGQLLVKLITNLSPFLSESWNNDNDSFFTRTDTELRKFKGACRTFLKAMSSDDHPIVMFLDDVQWMDEGSRQLASLFQQDDLSNFMLILTYRDEELASVADWLLHKDQLNSANLRVTDIPLKNLTVEAVNLLLADALEITNGAETLELGQLISSKTRGNVFHVIQFIEALNREGLLSFNEDTSAWDYDVDTIQREMMVHESLADLLALKIKCLSPVVLRTLQVASLLGYCFEEEVILEVSGALIKDGWSLAAVEESDHSTVVSVSLGEAFEMGFLERTSRGFQFVHDKLQSAFSSMFDAADLEELHRSIGETYLAKGGLESTYQAAVHLNQCSAYTNDAALRLHLAQINRDASVFCCDRSGFADAAQYLHRGLDLLDPDTKWASNFSLAFEMTELLARVELACGNFATCSKMVDEVLLRATSMDMKFDSLLIGVQCSLASNKMTEAANTASNLLKTCGFRIPRCVTLGHVLLKRMKVKALLVRRDDQAILRLPKMQDQMMVMAVQLLFLISSTCLLQESEELAVYAGLLATEITLKFGLAPHSPCAFTVFGLLEVSLGNVQQGYRLGKLALRLQQQLGCQDAESPTVAFSLLFLVHWKEPVREIEGQLHHAMESAYACGDITHAILCASLCNGCHLVVGENLSRVEQFLRVAYSRFGSLDNDGFVLMMQPDLQFVLNMQSEVNHWAELVNLTGEIMNEGEFVRKVLGEKNTTFYMIVLSFKAMLAYQFGFFAQAVSLYREMASISDAYQNSLSGPPFFLYGALSYYEQYRTTKKGGHLRKARRFLNVLKRIRAKGPNPNVPALIHLLLAVDESVRKSSSPLSLSLAFEKAIDECSAESMVHMEALANERAGFVFANLGLVADAERYFAQAADLYLYGWGATAKHDWLLEMSGKVLSQLERTTTVERLGGIIEMSLDGDDDNPVIGN